MQRNISKKPIIILGSLLTLLIVVTLIYGVSSAKNKELKLEQLIDTSYEVLDVRRHKKEKTYEVDIQAELSYADNILLANKLLKELESISYDWLRKDANNQAEEYFNKNNINMIEN